MKTKLTFAISANATEDSITIYEKIYPVERRLFLMRHDIMALAAFLNLYLATHERKEKV